MGTRGNIIVKESAKGVILTNIYHHMDSYPSYLGEKLAKFLKNRVVVNGISMAEDRRISNGVDDLAAQLVTLLKESPDDVGGVYLGRPRSPLGDPNDYTYVIYPETVTRVLNDYRTGKPFNYEEPVGGLNVIVYNWKKRIFRGTADEFAAWIEKEHSE